VSTFSYSPSFTASPHPLYFWDYHGRIQTRATAPIRPSLCPTTISRFRPPTTPPSVVSSANLNYCPAPTVSRLNAGVHISVNAFFRHTFLRLSSSPPITVRQPIVADPCLCEPLSSSSSRNKITHHHRFLFSKPNQRSPLLQSLPAPVSSSLVGIDPFASYLFSFLFHQGRWAWKCRFNSSIPMWTLAQQSWRMDIGNICSPTS